MDPDHATASHFFYTKRRETERPLEDLVSRLASSGVPAIWRQRFGIPSQQIRKAASELNADLVVVGTSRQTDQPDIILGSTAEGVLRGASCPVLIIHGRGKNRKVISGQAPTTGRTLNRILCAIDFSQCSVDALEYAAQLVQCLGISLTILHVLEPVPDLEHIPGVVPEDEPIRAKARSRLAEVHDVLTNEGLMVQTAISGGIHPSRSLQGHKQTGLI